MLDLLIDLAKSKIDINCKKLLSEELSLDLNLLDKTDQKHILKVIESLQNSQTKLRFALSQELQFMVEIMSLLNEDFLISLVELKQRIEKLEGCHSHEKGSLDSTKKEWIPNQVGNDTKTKTTESNNPIVPESPSPIVPQPTSPPSNVAISQAPISDLDLLWPKIVSLIESNPTKTLLSQSESYLLSVNSSLVEIGLSKDIFLPRLEKDEKKKEMILSAVKTATGIEPGSIKFRFLPRAINKSIEITSSPEINVQSPVLEYKKKSSESKETDDFTKAVEDLLGARQID